uniref:Uncharacterized protein n=1 Tax=Myotis myotis TaxID=51298 RepID=A0A7J7YF77_MYOMY|nr:hypothetical protein mMyoMyo1_011113 [Myotis myotis]
MNGWIALRVHQLLCAPPLHSLASRPSTEELKDAFYSAPPLFWGHTRALTAIPRHRPLGGAVAPLTQDGDTRQAEEQPPKGTWRGVPLRACQAGSFLLASFSHFRAARSFKPVPASTPPHLHPIPIACFPLSLVILGFLTLQTKVGPEMGARTGHRSCWGHMALSFQLIQASGLPELQGHAGSSQA